MARTCGSRWTWVSSVALDGLPPAGAVLDADAGGLAPLGGDAFGYARRVIPRNDLLTSVAGLGVVAVPAA